MQRKNNQDKGGLVVIALIAFAVGRWSVSSPAPAPLTRRASALPAVYVTPDINGAIGPASGRADRAETAASGAAAAQSGLEEKVYYARCADARAAGAAPIRAGEPGYAAHLDRDRDGVACE
jgi:hypothetical protein